MYDKIFVVAGHSETDPGAIAVSGMTERKIVREVSRKLLSYLGDRAIGIGIENGIDLTQKISSINTICDTHRFSYKNCLLISIHADWRGAPEGVGAYHYKDSVESKAFAEAVIDVVASVGNREKRYNKPDTSSRFGDAGLGIIRRTKPLAMLLECGSLQQDSNNSDGLELLTSEDGQDNIALMAAQAIQKFAGWDVSQRGKKEEEGPTEELSQPIEQTSIAEDLAKILKNQKTSYENAGNSDSVRASLVRTAAANSGFLIRDIQKKLGIPVSK